MSRDLILSDRLENVVAHLATGKSKLSGDAFGFSEISPHELTSMYRGDWMSRKIIDIPVKDCLRPGRDWQADASIIERIDGAEKRHGLWSKMATALKWARLYGGAAILCLNGEQNTAAPMVSVRRGKLRFVVLTKREIMPERLIDDATSDLFRRPEYYVLNTRDGGAKRVHHSRVIPFIGHERPDPEYNPDGWGDSVLQSVYDAIHHAALTSTGIAELVHEAKIDVIKVANLGSYLSTPQGTDQVNKRFALANMLKSINNMLLLSDGDEYERKQTSFAQLPDVLKSYLQIVAGAADIPATRMIGQSPGGLNATGDSDMANYYDHLESYRQEVIRPALERMDDLIWADEFGSEMPGHVWWEFAPLWQMSEKERAEVSAKKAETTIKYVNSGLIPEEILASAVANQLVEDGVYPGLDAAEMEAAIAAIRSARNDPNQDPSIDPGSPSNRAKRDGIPRLLQSWN